MAPGIPPSSERFDAITGLWTSPDGALGDPQRNSVDPGGQEAVILVDPVPPELVDLAEQPAPGSGLGASGRARLAPIQRLRWAILALLLVAVVAVAAGVAASFVAGSATFVLEPEHALLTHCGIDDLQYDGHWYERVGGILDDGNGNPPPGWDNPTQAGRLTAIGDERPPTKVVFTDDRGHHEEFALRAGAVDPKRICS